MGDNLLSGRESAWLRYADGNRSVVYDFADRYKEFLNANKTERQFVANTMKLLRGKGFVALDEFTPNADGGGAFFWNCKDKALIACKLGGKHPDSRFWIIASHVDSPRLDLKIRPFYESQNMCMAKTHFYGGIKYHPWVGVPMSMIGIVCTKHGQVEISIGENDGDYRFIIPELAAHTSDDQLDKQGKKMIDPEDLNFIAGTIPAVGEKDEKEDALKKAVLQRLFNRYGIVENDFISCELEMVPSCRAFDSGFDGSLVVGYGHDDKSCAYSSLRAFLDSDQDDFTRVVVFADKEEIGSTNNSGLDGYMLMNFIDDMLEKISSPSRAIDVLRNSIAVSADGTAAVDPTLSDVSDLTNGIFLGYGAFVERYASGGGKSYANEASAPYTAFVRKLFDDGDIPYQVGEMCKMGKGGGGTVSMYLSRYGMDAIDVGIPMLGLHAPLEIISKVDLYCSYLFYKRFFDC